MSLRQTVVDFPVRKIRTTNKKVKISSPDHKVDENDICFVADRRVSVKRKLTLDVNDTVNQNFEASENNTDSTRKYCLHNENHLSSKTNASVLIPFQQAKKALHTSLPERLLGRDKEKLTIADFLSSHLENKQPGSLYISGAPGTGKTAVLLQILEEKFVDNFKCVYVNCMSLKRSFAVYQKIAKELGFKTTENSKATICKDLENKLVTAKNMIVLVLDEIDQLDSKNQEVLYTLFEWPHLPSSKIVLIGIANALDLTDRVLPRLHAYGCKPELLHFQPYTQQQILCILEDRMKAAETTGIKIIQLSALSLCAGKVAATSGDIRKALDVCRRAIEMAEAENKQQKILKVSCDDGCNPGSPRKRLALISPLQVNISHINSVLQEVYGSRILPHPSSQHEERTIPLQQKVILCTTLLVIKTVKLKEIKIAILYSSYSKVCKRQQISALNQEEFFSTCSLLESQGLVNLKKQKDARSSKVSLKVDENELESVLQDRTLMASILGDCSTVKIM